MQPARPRPDPDLLDRSRVDRNNNNLAGGLTLFPGEPHFEQRIAHRTVQARHHDRGKLNHHENMRPIAFQILTPPHFSPTEVRSPIPTVPSPPPPRAPCPNPST